MSTVLVELHFGNYFTPFIIGAGGYKTDITASTIASEVIEGHYYLKGTLSPMYTWVNFQKVVWVYYEGQSLMMIATDVKELR